MNIALTAFLASFDKETTFGQLLIRRAAGGFELCHTAEAETLSENLRLLDVRELRALAQFTATGLFRPLKSAPNLRCRWQCLATDEHELEQALSHLYPGAVADWFAVRSGAPPITSYRQFTARQTGMYRITTMLSDEIAAAAIRACCHPDFCLKRRLWSVEGLAPDAPEEKSAIPCLEPCAVLLEFARKVARLEQETSVAIPPLAQPDPTVAETDFDSARNPRRVRYALEKQTMAHQKPLA
ncbi:MAG TPA: DR2241 family protein [Verrucomicrobiae bacterium]|jgi:hypothetical protein